MFNAQYFNKQYFAGQYFPPVPIVISISRIPDGGGGGVSRKVDEIDYEQVMIDDMEILLFVCKLLEMQED